VVCFDLGGVVIRICRSWAEGCARAGLEVRAPERRDATAELRGKAVLEYQTGRIDCDAFACRISTLLEGAYSPEEVMAVHRAWIIDEYEGIATLIDRLNACGIRTACLSNTNHAHWLQIRDYPAIQRLRTRLASHLLGLHKPDPEIYREAQRRLAASPEEILFFDDLEENVDGARQCGWRAERVDPLAATDAQIGLALQSHGVRATPHRSPDQLMDKVG
jgi:putative hydrolase of the HAD superfamily